MTNSTATAPLETGDYQPALLIGLGGTGIRTLRFVRWIAENGGDPALAAALESGRIGLIGFDTDDGDNSVSEIDSHVLSRPAGWSGDWSRRSRSLPCLEDGFHLIPTQNIGDTLSILRRSLHERDKQVEERGYWSYYDWLPKGRHQTLQALGSGQDGTKGASQWRPLGRMALCSEADKVISALVAAAKRVEFHLPDGVETTHKLRVHLVCSLSGGTGAGMFWDVALLLRDHLPNCMISGSFLLADSFVGAVNTHRVQANCYASLKELAAYKNWCLHPGERLSMRYQIDLGTRTLERVAGQAGDFESVYLYRNFKPASVPSRGQNVTRTQIDTNCLRIAESLVARQRNDVRLALDGNGRNAATDRDALNIEPEREYVFSTSTAVRLEVGSPEQAAFGLRAALFRLLHDRTGGVMIPVVDGRSLIATLGDALPPDADRILGRNGSLGGAWASGLIAAAGPVLARSKERWEALLDEIRKQAVRIQAGDFSILGDPKNGGEAAADKPAWERRAEAVRALYGLIDPAVGQAWRQTLTDAAGRGRQGSYSLALLCLRDLDASWQALIARLRSVVKDMRASPRLLDPRVALWVDNSLAESAAEKGRVELPVLPAAIPVSVHHLRSELGFHTPGEAADMTAALQVWQGGPVDVMAGRLCTDLEQAVDGFRPTPAIWQDLVRHFVSDRRAALDSVLTELKEADADNRRLLADRNARVEAAARRSVNMAHLSPDHAYQRSHLALLPIHGELSRLHAESTPLLSRFDAVGQTLANLAASRAKEAGERAADRQEEVRLPQDDYKKWSSFLETLSSALDGASAQPAPSREPDGEQSKRFMTALAGALDSAFLDSADPATISNPLAFDSVLRTVGVIADAFTTYWLEQPAFLVRRLGGEDGIRDLIRRCHSTVFASSTAAKSIQLPRLIVALPAIGSTLSEDTANRSLEHLQDIFTSAARTVLQLEPSFTATASGSPLIYLEDLYHPGRSIRGIEHLEHHYDRVDERIRPLLHFHRDAESLPPLAPAKGSQAAVLCGNPGCTYDLTGLPRDRLACPGCHGPILNRCGNLECKVDNLTTRLDPGSLRENSRCPDPECGGKLHTYWWNCGVKAHAREQRSTRDGVCADCMAEYQDGRRAYLEIGRWNPEAPLDCPGCLAEVADPAGRRQVPGHLRRQFEDGVLPTHAMDFRNAARKAKLAPDECLQSEGRMHMLFPTIEVELNGRRELQPVHREESWFITADRSISVSHSCFHCGYPIHIPKGAVKPMDPIECPRCLRPVRECVYCTHIDHKLFAPRGEAGGTERCPRCDNLMTGRLRNFNAKAVNGLGSPAHCRNLLTCRAGSRPWSTATELDRGHCACCSTPAQKTPLLNRSRFEAEIDRCPHCRSLVGRKDETVTGDGEMVLSDVAGILGHFAARPAEDLEEPCAICSAKPIVVLDWMWKTGYFASLSDRDHGESKRKIAEMVAEQSDPVPAIIAGDGLDILTTIRRMGDTTLLYEALFAQLRAKFNPAVIHQELDRLYTQQSPCQLALTRCFSRLEEEYQRIGPVSA